MKESVDGLAPIRVYSHDDGSAKGGTAQLYSYRDDVAGGWQRQPNPLGDGVPMDVIRKVENARVMTGQQDTSNAVRPESLVLHDTTTLAADVAGKAILTKTLASSESGESAFTFGFDQRISIQAGFEAKMDAQFVKSSASFSIGLGVGANQQWTDRATISCSMEGTREITGVGTFVYWQEFRILENVTVAFSAEIVFSAKRDGAVIPASDLKKYFLAATPQFSERDVAIGDKLASAGTVVGERITVTRKGHAKGNLGFQGRSALETLAEACAHEQMKDTVDCIAFIE